MSSSSDTWKLENLNLNFFCAIDCDLWQHSQFFWRFSFTFTLTFCFDSDNLSPFCEPWTTGCRLGPTPPTMHQPDFNGFQWAPLINTKTHQNFDIFKACSRKSTIQRTCSIFFVVFIVSCKKKWKQYTHVHIELEKVCDTISEQVQRTCPQLILPLAGSPEHQTQRSFPGYWMIMMRGNMMR